MILHPADMTLGQRIMLTLVIVLVILFALAAFGYFTGGWDDAQGQSLADYGTNSKFEPRLVVLDREAVDNAYRIQIEHLMQNWFRDSTGQPARAVVGARNARKAYIGAMIEIEKREQFVPGEAR